MAASMLFTCAVESSCGSWGALHMPCGQLWWLPQSYIHTLWTGVVAARMLYLRTVYRSGSCQDAMHVHWAGVVAASTLRQEVKCSREIPPPPTLTIRL
jgi:hypothetical protein